MALATEERLALVQLCQQRSSTYMMLSRLYREEVDAQLLESLRKTSFPARTGNDDVDAGYRKLAVYLSGVSEGALLELAIDYTRVFIGHGTNAYSAAYPFESVYTSEKRLLMQEARDEFMAEYRAAGMEIAAAWKDPEDHIALELEYMSVLCARCAEALDAEDEDGALALMGKQRAFLAQHLAAWAPMFTADVKRFARTEFYQGLACLTEGFLRMDRSFTSELVAAEPEGCACGCAAAGAPSVLA